MDCCARVVKIRHAGGIPDQVQALTRVLGTLVVEIETLFLIELAVESNVMVSWVV